MSCAILTRDLNDDGTIIPAGTLVQVVGPIRQLTCVTLPHVHGDARRLVHAAWIVCEPQSADWPYDQEVDR